MVIFLLIPALSGTTVISSICILLFQGVHSNGDQEVEEQEPRTTSQFVESILDENDTTNHETSSTTGIKEYECNVSSRCIIASQSMALPYKASLLKALQDPCHPMTNKKGYITLCRAENKLITNELKAYFSEHSQSIINIAFGDENNYFYDDVRGMEGVRKIVASFITRKFINGSLTNSSTYDDNDDGNTDGKNNDETTTEQYRSAAKPDQIVLGSGAASILNYLFYLLGEEKEAVLIPAPYYAAFQNDTKVIARCVPYPVFMADISIGPTVDELEAVYQELKAKSIKVKMLLLTNPNNPLGTIYSPSVIKNCISWARAKKVHTIVDEIYALSVHDNNNDTFQSVSRILNNELGNDVHLVWALSKDFGSSGFRIGVLYTQNELIISALNNINMFCSVSHPMQAIVKELLSDDVYIDNFLDMSRLLLKKSYDIVTSGLEKMGIPFIKAQAGIFIYVDFSSLLRVNSFDGEDELAKLFENYARIVMTPGSSQSDNKPGRFRICYAFVSVEVLEVAMLRLACVVKMLKEYGWENIKKHIDETTFLTF